MMKVVVTLVTYEDWVWSHPDPALVSNYMIAGGNAFQGELAEITELVQRGWHTDPSPSAIAWLGVAIFPKPLRLIDGEVVHIEGHRAYIPATVEIVFDQKVSQYLNRNGDVVGHSPGGGKRAFAVMLNQGPDARWRIVDIDALQSVPGRFKP